MKQADQVRINTQEPIDQKNMNRQRVDLLRNRKREIETPLPECSDTT